MNRKYILPLLLPVQLILLRIAALFPDWVEEYYSNGLYKWLSGTSRSILGWSSISIGDLCYFVVGFLILRWFYITRKTWPYKWRDHLLKILGTLSVALFFFNLCWGGNYHRVPLYQKLGIEKKYNIQQLHAFTINLIGITNAAHDRIADQDTVQVVFPYTQEQVFVRNLSGYNTLAKMHPEFEYERSSIKKSLISLPLTYMGFAGYLNPFTGEAQVNSKLPMYNFPTTACHEMAHQIGYASESEANFIGYLASVNNSDPYYQYSGYTFALKYCLSTMERIQKGSSKPYRQMIHPGILKNFEESKTFWRQHQTFIEDGFALFYDNFLKLNRQKDGLESYSKFVDLLVNYHKIKSL